MTFFKLGEWGRVFPGERVVWAGRNDGEAWGWLHIWMGMLVCAAGSRVGTRLWGP